MKRALIFLALVVAETAGVPLMAGDLKTVPQYAGNAPTVTTTTEPMVAERRDPALSTPGVRLKTTSSRDKDDTIVVDVWSAAAPEGAEAKKPDASKLSPSFTVAALSAATRMQFTERKIANSIRMGFGLGEFWIQLDFDAIDDALGVAALSAKNDADQQTLQQLQEEASRLHAWCDWLIEQKHDMRLADYYISPSALNNDEQYQSAVACNNFLLSMLKSGRFAEDNSCR